MRAQKPYRTRSQQAPAALGTAGPLELQPAFAAQAKSLQAESPFAPPNLAVRPQEPWREHLLQALAQWRLGTQRRRHDRQ